MNDYQLGFTHACRLIEAELKKHKMPNDIMEIIEHVEEEELESIRRGIGF